MLIADPRSARRPLPDLLPAAIRGGVDAVQIRCPGLPAGELLEVVRAAAPAVREGGARLLVNDRIDVALAAGADGVHLKTTSLLPAEARRLLGRDRLVGVSTHTPEEVLAAFDGGADYVVFGPVFATPSKAGLLDPRGPGGYHAVASRAPGPVLALGGVDGRSVRRLAAGPLHGVAVIRAVLSANDPEAAARELAAYLEPGRDP
jgi:thiamine-phosphate pyrophosphorylase